MSYFTRELIRRAHARNLVRAWLTRPDAACIMSHLFDSVGPDKRSSELLARRIHTSHPEHHNDDPEFDRTALLGDIQCLAEAAGASEMTITDFDSGMRVRVYAIVTEYGHDDDGHLVAPVERSELLS